MSDNAIFEWSDDKAEANLAKHGVTFDFAMAVFADPESVTVDTIRAEDNEDRQKVVGLVRGKLYIAVFHRRGETVRIISARRANGQEMKIYGNR